MELQNCVKCSVDFVRMHKNMNQNLYKHEND